MVLQAKRPTIEHSVALSVALGDADVIGVRQGVSDPQADSNATNARIRNVNISDSGFKLRRRGVQGMKLL
jgi:hypothetical protein